MHWKDYGHCDGQHRVEKEAVGFSILVNACCLKQTTAALILPRSTVSGQSAAQEPCGCAVDEDYAELLADKYSASYMLEASTTKGLLRTAAVKER